MSQVMIPSEQEHVVPAVAYAALGVAGKKIAEQTRNDLKPGKHEIDATFRVSGVLTVGHDTETAATVTPDQNELVAYLLSKLNKRTREQVLRDLPGEFASLGQMPVVDKDITGQSAVLLANLRRKVLRPRRGAVSGDLQLELEGCEIDGRSAQLALVTG